MEKTQQQEKLPITGQQIKEFQGWYKKFSGKGKMAYLGPGKTETAFTAYEKDGKKYINAKNVLMNATWVYDPEENTISVFHDDTNTLGRTLAEDGPLDQKNLETDLMWFKNSVPSFTEKVQKKIKDVLSNN